MHESIGKQKIKLMQQNRFPLMEKTLFENVQFLLQVICKCFLLLLLLLLLNNVVMNHLITRAGNFIFRAKGSCEKNIVSILHF